MDGFIPVRIKQIENGILPSYTREADACFDCKARVEKDLVIKSGCREQVPLGFALQPPKGYEVQVRPRSGLTKRGIDVGFGTGDEQYTGEYQATVINNSGEDFVVHNGDRICQMALKPVYKARFELVNELDNTERGSSGFGSSGLRPF